MATAKNCTRVNLNIPNDLLKEIDDYGKRMGLNNRTSAICLMVSTVLDQRKSIDAMSKIDMVLKALEEKNGV